MTYELHEKGVREIGPNHRKLIPEGGRDWSQYQRWLRAGGVPDPIPVVVKPPVEDQVETRITNDPVFLAMLKRQARVEGKTMRQMLDEVRAEVT